MSAPSRGKSHLFIGLVDKKKYKHEHLMSTFWKDCPCSLYWDVWNTKTIETNEEGVQIATEGGYGCKCEGIMIIKIIKQGFRFCMMKKIKRLVSLKME